MVLLAAILLIAAFFRLYRLETAPPGLQHDEVFHGHDASVVLQGAHRIYFESNAGNEPLFVYLMAGTIALFGSNYLGIRLAAVLCGLATIVFTYLLARKAFGYRVALLTSAGSSRASARGLATVWASPCCSSWPATPGGLITMLSKQRAIKWYDGPYGLIFPDGGKQALYIFPASTQLHSGLREEFFQGARLVEERRFPDSELAFSAYELEARQVLQAKIEALQRSSSGRTCSVSPSSKRGSLWLIGCCSNRSASRDSDFGVCHKLHEFSLIFLSFVLIREIRGSERGDPWKKSYLAW